MTVRLTPVLLLAGAAAAQEPARPAIRQLGPTVATSSETIGLVTNVRALPGGRLLINDVARRRVVLFDSTLATFAVVADSTSETANAYGPRPGALVPFRGDSTLFVDPASLSMLVVDPAGKIGRVMSVPRSQDAGSLGSVGFGGTAFDPAGRLVYRAFPTFAPRRGPNGEFMPPEQPDSAAIVRVDLATRKLDTVAFLKVPVPRMNVTRTDDGGVRMTSEVNPLPLTDEWAMLPDGTVALLRGRDYHVDWVAPDGSRATSPKVPFDWQRLTDEDKVALIDSVKAMRARMGAGAAAGLGGGPQVQIRGGGPPGGAGGPPPGPPAGGGGERVIVMGGPGGGGPNMPNMQLTFVSPSELPDYKPPFLAGAVRVDAEGNLWVRTVPTRAIPGGPVYDVINRKGELAERVQIPADRQIVGFGPGGDVYLASRVAPGAGPNVMSGMRIERARVR